MTQNEANTAKNMTTFGTLDLNADIKEPTILATVVLKSDKVNGLGGTGIGLARCKPDDHFDINVGMDIAVGRAMQDLGRALEKEGLDASITEEQHEWFQALDKFFGVVSDSLKQMTRVFPRG